MPFCELGWQAILSREETHLWECSSKEALLLHPIQTQTHTLSPQTYLGDGKDSLPAGHNLVPFVMKHVHETIRLVATDKLRHVA